MLYLPLSKIVKSTETLVASGASVAAEGAALVRAAGASASGVTVSQGTSGEIFAGFSFAGVSAAPFPITSTSKAESFTVPSSGTVTLAFTPISGQVLIYDKTAGAVVAISGGVSVTGNTVAGLTSGNSVLITYKYTLTSLQAIAMQGDVQPGGYAGARIGQIGLIQGGVIYTDQFDASKDYSNVAKDGLLLGANGIVTTSGSGVAIAGAYVVALPTVEVPFLGFEFTAA